MNIPMVELKGQYDSVRGGIDNAVLQAQAEIHCTFGPFVQVFEDKTSSYLGADNAVNCESITVALRPQASSGTVLIY